MSARATLQIHTADFIPAASYVPLPNVYSYRPAGKWPWLQRLIFRLLKRLDCAYAQPVATVKTTTIELDKVGEAIFETIYLLSRSGLRPAAVVMGRDAYARLLDETDPWLPRPLDFRFPDNYRAAVHPAYLETVFAGLPVYVLPWCDGLMVLPDTVEAVRPRAAAAG